MNKNDIYVERAAERHPRESSSIKQAAAKASNQTRLTGGFLSVMEAYNPKQARLVKGERYQDIFEDLMRYGAEEDNIVDEATLKEELDKALSEGTKRPSRKSTMKNSSYQAMLNKLASRIASDAPRARELIQERRGYAITDDDERTRQQVSPKKQERFREDIKKKKPLYSIYDTKTRKRRIIRKTTYERWGRTNTIYQDYNTGKIIKKPKGIR